jgi:CRISPR-associated protein Cmr2
MKTYLSLTIGPIYKTIQRASKTRELWAASFVLSEFMRIILEKLSSAGFGHVLSPDVTHLTPRQKHRGAGVWNDNCTLEIPTDQVAGLKEKLPALLEEAKSDLAELLLQKLPHRENGLDRRELQTIIGQHFHVHAAFLPSPPSDGRILRALGDLTAAAEMQRRFSPRHDDFLSKLLFRGEAVRHLYNKGFDENDDIFTFYQTPKGKRRRLPSLIELAVREFKSDPAAYAKVEEAINKHLQNLQDEEDDVETDEENTEIVIKLKELKSPGGSSRFRKRHKYVALISADGDGIGSKIQSLSDTDEITAFSKELMAFATRAVELVADFGAVPIYAGGDDLLFVAPLQNQTGRSLFDLLSDLHCKFSEQEKIREAGGTLSFGVSVFYYKYPLGEALENSRSLLKYAAKKLVSHPRDGAAEIKKNALALRIHLHGGQSFGAVLHQTGMSWDKWTSLLQTASGTDTAFVTGVIHTLEQLEFLLEHACENDLTEHFFEHHFNEAKGSESTWKFIETVRKLAVAIYQEYAQLIIDEADRRSFFGSHLHLAEDFWEKTKSEDLDKTLRSKFCNNLLYSALRTVQFLNADDHE